LFHGFLKPYGFDFPHVKGYDGRNRRKNRGGHLRRALKSCFLRFLFAVFCFAPFPG